MTGEILFLPHRLPYPPDRGDRIRAWHVLKALARLAPTHVIAPLDDADDVRHLDAVRAVAASLDVRVRRRTKFGAIAHSIFSGRPASVELFRDEMLIDAVNKRVEVSKIEVIYAHSGQMAAYVPSAFDGRFVMDFVDVDSAKFAARGGLSAVEGRRLRRWEIAAACRASRVLFVSEPEAALFRRTTGLACDVLEMGVDLDQLDPRSRYETPLRAAQIVFTGQMDYAPNVEAVIEFARGALPRIRARIPGVTFAIVGRAPTAAVRSLASQSVVVTGAVPDTRPWLAAADVVVAPLLQARGVQTKVLEAMAMGKATVASPQAAEGIDAAAGRDLEVVVDPVDTVVRLLTDHAARTRLGAAARAQMETRYRWDHVLRPLAGYLRA